MCTRDRQNEPLWSNELPGHKCRSPPSGMIRHKCAESIRRHATQPLARSIMRASRSAVRRRAASCPNAADDTPAQRRRRTSARERPTPARSHARVPDDAERPWRGERDHSVAGDSPAAEPHDGHNGRSFQSLKKRLRLQRCSSHSLDEQRARRAPISERVRSRDRRRLRLCTDHRSGDPVRQQRQRYQPTYEKRATT